jgi:hypothetical protein
MRELIDVNFIDKTNYAGLVSGDAGGILISHFWGPVGVLNRLTLSEFLNFYPTSSKRLHSSWINAYRAFQSGLGYVDVMRVLGTNDGYNYFLLTDTEHIKVAEDLKTLTEPAIALRYAGVPPQLIDGKILIISLEDISSEDGYNDPSFPPAIRVKVFLSDPVELPDTIETVIAGLSPVETFEGVTEVGFLLDGTDAFIGSKIQAKSKFLQFVNNGSDSFDLFELVTTESPIVTSFSFDAATSTIVDKTADELAALYPEVFSDIELAKSTILIDPGTSTVDAANTFLSAASVSARSDLVAILGYPTASAFSEAAILAYKKTLSPAQFGALYATRELVTVNGVNYTSNGAGTIAGRIAAVSASSNVNQLASAKTWGAFGGVITEALDFKAVLRLQEAGVNSVYRSVDGARIFGIRSLHARANSYYAKFNVSRVAARILRYGFEVALNAIHVGNTGELKASVSNLLNADLNRLKASGDIKAQSSVLCSDANNQDIDTNGGEILIIDYEIYFIKLVERVRFTITATDTSVSVSQS